MPEPSTTATSRHWPRSSTPTPQIAGTRGDQSLEEWLDTMRAPRSFPTSMHVLGEPLIDRRRLGRGRPSTPTRWSTNSVTRATGQGDLTLGMRYLDQVVVEQGRWVIREALLDRGLDALSRGDRGLRPRRLRMSRPGVAPVGSPSRMVTRPLTSVAGKPSDRCSSRRPPAGRSSTSSGTAGAHGVRVEDVDVGDHAGPEEAAVGESPRRARAPG